MKKEIKFISLKWDPRWDKCLPLITQDKRKPSTVQQEPASSEDLSNLLGFCRLCDSASVEEKGRQK